MTTFINRYKNDQEFSKEIKYMVFGTLGTALIIVPPLYIGTLIGYMF